jgi:maltose O-acetyltransferase
MFIWSKRRGVMPKRSEKKKMLAGEMYSFLDPDLEAERQKAKELMLRYNRVESEDQRQALLPQMLGGVGKNSLIWPPFYFTYGKNIYLGDHVFLNYMCTILDNNEVRFGNHVMVGPAVQFLTAAHSLDAEERNRGLEVAKPITIGDNVWIGGGAILLPGVTIGRNAVVGAGAVVTKNVLTNTIAAGNPARVIRELSHSSSGH